MVFRGDEKIKKLILLLLLVLPVAIASEDFTPYSWADMELAINSNIGISGNGDSASISMLIAELSLYPITTQAQTVSNMNFLSTPAAKVQPSNNKIIYKWENPIAPISLGLTANVKVDSVFTQVTNKIQFPIKELNYTYMGYVQPAEYIDITPEIRSKADELAAGEDDMYDVAFKIAEWVRTNVNYNLSTMTEKVVQKSSWVLANREGVCDEITNLFISMLRSVGIPARFVSGIAYTNTENIWGNHGWAEVYFPGYGWVPFDVTFGQYGFVDPSHIVLDYSVDSHAPSLTLQGSMHNMEFSDTTIEIKANLISKSKTRPELVRMELELPDARFGPNSYVPVRIKLENMQPYYIPVQLRVTKAPSLTEDSIKSILLKPRQEKSMFWTVKLSGEVKSNYLYSTVFEVVNSFGAVESEKIEYSEGYKTYSKEQADAKIKEYEDVEEISYSENIDIDCKPEKKFYYDYEKANIICAIKNIGNQVIQNIGICVDSNCQSLGLHIGESKNIKFENLESNKEFEIKASNGKINLNEKFTVKSLTDPKLKITNVKYPEAVYYSGIGDISFILGSEAPVRNIVFKMNGKEFFKQDAFTGAEERIFTLNGKYYYSQEKSHLIIEYEDENGYKYATEKSFFVKVKDVPVYAKFFSYIRNIFSSS